MTRLKALGSIASILVFLFAVPGSHQQLHTYDWPKTDVPKWDNFNSLFAFESSRVIPPSETGNGIGQNPGYAHLYFNFGPKPNIIIPNAGVPYIPEIPRDRPQAILREINVTQERMGGYGGYGDTRGYGAYEYKHKIDDNDFPMPIADFLRSSRKNGKKPFIDTFFNLLPMEDI